MDRGIKWGRHLVPTNSRNLVRVLCGQGSSLLFKVILRHEPAEIWTLGDVNARKSGRGEGCCPSAALPYLETELAQLPTASPTLSAPAGVAQQTQPALSDRTANLLSNPTSRNQKNAFLPPKRAGERTGVQRFWWHGRARGWRGLPEAAPARTLRPLQPRWRHGTARHGSGEAQRVFPARISSARRSHPVFRNGQHPLSQYFAPRRMPALLLPRSSDRSLASTAHLSQQPFVFCPTNITKNNKHYTTVLTHSFKKK